MVKPQSMEYPYGPHTVITLRVQHGQQIQYNTIHTLSIEPMLSMRICIAKQKVEKLDKVAKAEK